MSRLLLDTSAYSAFFRGDAQAKAAIQDADDICLNPIVIGELLAGFGRGKRRSQNESELAEFLGSPRARVVAINEETASRYAVIVGGLWTAGTPIPTNDVWIAASAMQHGLEVLTADAHYALIPQIVVKALGRAQAS